LGIRTIFNILGPLANPAGATHQLLGAGRPELRTLLAGAMAKLGTTRTLVVSGDVSPDDGGLGDVTLAGTTHVTEVTPGGVREFTWRPEDFGVSTQPLDGLTVDGPAGSAALIRAILDGKSGPARDIVVLNAAAAIYTIGFADNPHNAAAHASVAIDGGHARVLLEQLVERSHAG
jgi:anthranilate phosphoribosyltransferase